MLTQFRFENFKSWRDTGEIRMTPLTGIFGTNSSGKTAILQFLLMLKQTAESNEQFILYLGNDRTYVNLGTSFDISNQHIFPQNIKFSLSWEPQIPYLKSIYYSVNPCIFDVVNSISLGSKDKTRKTENKSIITLNSTIKLLSISSISLGEFEYKFKGNTDSQGKMGVRVSSLSDKLSYGNDDTYIGFSEGILDGLNCNFDFSQVGKPLKNYKFPSDFVINEFKGFPETLVLNFERQLKEIYYLGPLREYPRRSYPWSGEEPQGVGGKGEFIASALLISRNNNLNVEKHVAYWLKELGLIHDFQIQPIAENRSDYEIKVRRFPDSPQVLITDVGFGVSQILPVLVLCYYVPEGSTIIFEQPEIHLHPSVQAGLADVFIDVIKNRNVQIILESHSEHLLRRLQRRIAEEHNHMTAEDAALYFCSIDDTGTSKLTSLELDTYGNINNWPQGFFGDEMGDLVAMTEAAMRRQMPKS